MDLEGLPEVVSFILSGGSKGFDRCSGGGKHTAPQSPSVISLHRLSDCLTGKRKLVVADSLFSMDGDYADLQGLVALKTRHDFALMLDEAHATLVCGERCVPPLGRVP